MHATMPVHTARRMESTNQWPALLVVAVLSVPASGDATGGGVVGATGGGVVDGLVSLVAAGAEIFGAAVPPTGERAVTGSDGKVVDADDSAVAVGMMTGCGVVGGGGGGGVVIELGGSVVADNKVEGTVVLSRCEVGGGLVLIGAGTGREAGVTASAAGGQVVTRVSGHFCGIAPVYASAMAWPRESSLSTRLPSFPRKSKDWPAQHP